MLHDLHRHIALPELSDQLQESVAKKLCAALEHRMSSESPGIAISIATGQHMLPEQLCSHAASAQVTLLLW